MSTGAPCSFLNSELGPKSFGNVGMAFRWRNWCMCWSCLYNLQDRQEFLSRGLGASFIW